MVQNNKLETYFCLTKHIMNLSHKLCRALMKQKKICYEITSTLMNKKYDCLINRVANLVHKPC